MSAGVKRAAQVLPGVVLSAAGLMLAARGVEWLKVAAVIARAQPLPLLGAAFASMAAIVAAGLRWRLAARPHADLARGDAIDIVTICNLVNMILARFGDLVRAGLTAQVDRAHSARVLGGVIVERFVDVFMLLAFAGGLSQVVPFPPAVQTGVLLFAAVAAIALVMIWWAAPWFASAIRRVVGIVWPRGGDAIAGFVESMSDGVQTSARSGELVRVAGWSFVVWVLSALAIILVLTALDVPVPWIAGVFALVVINLGGSIPASPGAIGVYHYLFVLAMSVWITDPSVALGTAVVSHALGVVVSVALGIVGLVRQGISVTRLTSMLRPVGEGASP
jgi:glycosyltransferase 2 family protein